MATDRIRQALSRTEAHLFGETHAGAVLARHEAGRPDAGDAEAASGLVRGLEADQRTDGSWNGGLAATAEALLQLHDLIEAGEEVPMASPAVRHGLDWIRSRRRLPGRFGSECTPATHALGFCPHFLSGFLAPTEEGDLVLACGARVPDGVAVQLAASCLGLQAMLRWGMAGPDVELHLDGLRRILRLEPRQLFTLVPVEAVPLGLAALLEAPASDDTDTALRTGVGAILQMQRADGSWPELDAFSILDALLGAARRLGPVPQLHAALQRGAGVLAMTQHADGTWERQTVPIRTLIGWRVLRHAATAAPVMPVE